MKNELVTGSDFIDRYDHMILSDAMKAMYGYSGFYNVGDWTNHPSTLEAACNALVIKHLDLVAMPQDPVRILDAGCGLGMGAGVIAQRFGKAHVVGINISEKQISFAQEVHAGIDFRVMDATRMEFPDENFDLIISVEAAFHFDTRKDFLDCAYRKLRPGGQLIFSDMLLNNTEWVGSWSVPAANLITDINDYTQLCTAAGFQLHQCNDIKNSSINGFCNHLRNVMQLTDLANGLENSVIAYLLTSLKKP
ncbi:SAM-dependent methyltransferase [Pedobacter sp. KACC 23697]|uniref:Class I SAM-dependent methyltransferase n=1 Tax=Pedobacter sp. KACC 23697 TaxID=3149230 RepID=A0AAU7KAS5_9SPHI